MGLNDLTFALLSGMNRMLKVYTSDIFRISPNFFHVVLYFDKKSRELNVTENVVENVTETVTERQKQILSLIIKDNKITTSELAAELAVTRMTISREISALKSLKILERIGGDKGGHWKVINQTK